MGTSSAASREMPKSFSVPCSDGDFMVMVIFQVGSKDGDLPMDGDFPVRYISY